MSNSENGAERHEGLIPVVEDWHAKMCLLEVLMYNIIYTYIDIIAQHIFIQVLWKRMYSILLQ